MAISFLDIIKDSLAKGLLFSIKPGGNLDNIFSGIADYIKNNPFAESEKLRYVTNPNLTTQLNDLERDYGLINDPNLTESEKRQFLSVFAYQENGNGSRLFLQNRLRTAGKGLSFENINVIENSPKLDPNIFLGSEYQLYCGDENAYCGDGEAYLGEGTGGELFIDNVNLYNVPSNERENFVFFVGGEATGWILIDDSNMEEIGTEHWTADIDTLVEKDKTKHVSGEQSLRVTDADSTAEQEPYPLLADPTLVGAYRFYDLDLDLNRPYASDVKNLTDDYDMEYIDSTYWLESTGASCVKDTFYYHSFNQSLSVYVEVGGLDYVYQEILEIGKKYIVDLFFKSNDSSDVILMNGSTIVGISTVSDTGFNPHHFEFTATDTKLGISCANNQSLFYIDNVICYQDEYNYITNGKFNTILGWSEYQSPSYSITESYEHISGLACLRMLTGDNGVYQATLDKGRRYKIVGYVKGEETDGRSGNPVIKNGFVTSIFRLSENVLPGDFGDWYNFEVEFTATEDEVYLTVEEFGTPVGDMHGFFDNIIIYKVHDHSIQNIAYRNFINDGSTEYSDTSFWSAGNSATLSKDISDFVYGDQSLRVTYNAVSNAYAYQLLKPVQGKRYILSGYGKGYPGGSGFGVKVDGVLTVYGTSDWYYFERDFVCSDSSENEIQLYNYTNSVGAYSLFDHISLTEYGDIFPVRFDRSNSLIDGDFEDPNTSCFESFNSTVTKITDDVYIGNKALKVEVLGSGYSQVWQNCLMPGKTYTISGYVKISDPSLEFRVMDGSTIIWQSSNISGWQVFYVRFIATDDDLRFRHLGSVGDYFIIDDVYLQEVPPQNVNGLINVDELGRNLYFNSGGETGDIPDTNGLSNICITFDIKIPNETDDCYIFNSAGKLNCYIDSGVLTMRIDDASTSVYLTYSINISDNKWHNIAFNYWYNGDSELWVDGALSDTDSFQVLDTYFDSIKIDGSSGDLFYIQNIFIYDFPKEESQILTIYRQFLDVTWGGSVIRNNSSGLLNLSDHFQINSKAPFANVHLFPEDISVTDWYSRDRDNKLFMFVGQFDWRTLSQTTVNVTIKGTDGYSVYFDWGDGNNNTANMLGDTISININNTYTVAGYKTILFSGDVLEVDYIKVSDSDISAVIGSFYGFENLSYLDLSGSPIGIDETSIPFNNGIDIVLTDCELSSIEIDRLLVGLYNANIQNLILYINGNNEIRTGASDVAYAWLVANGATIYEAYNVQIISVDGDNIIDSDQTNVVIVGSDFISTQGIGKVEITDNIDYSASTKIIEQSYDSWSDTSIQIDIVPGNLLD